MTANKPETMLPLFSSPCITLYVAGFCTFALFPHYLHALLPPHFLSLILPQQLSSLFFLPSSSLPSLSLPLSLPHPPSLPPSLTASLQPYQSLVHQFRQTAVSRDVLQSVSDFVDPDSEVTLSLEPNLTGTEYENGIPVVKGVLLD